MTNQARSTNNPDNSRAAQAELIARPVTVPAYYLGRPATAWLAIFRKERSRASRV
jgi:hypothetical protein